MNVEYWRWRFQNVWPDGTFDKYLNANPKFLFRKFGPDAVEYSGFALEFARMGRASNVLSEGKYNHILASYGSYSQKLMDALGSQQALNALIATTPEYNIGGVAPPPVATPGIIPPPGVMTPGRQLRPRVAPARPGAATQLFIGPVPP